MQLSLIRPLAILTAPLLGGLAAYIVARRPRQRSSWAFAGILLGFLLFHLGNVFLFMPNLSPAANDNWQRLQLHGAGLASISAVFLALALHEYPLARWERILRGLTVGAILLFAVRNELVRPTQVCFTPAGTPRIDCGWSNIVGSATTAVVVMLVIALFWRAAFVASGRRAQILRRHLLSAITLCVGSGAVNLLFGLTGRLLLPTELLTLAAAAVITRMLLLLEEEETGLPTSSLGLFVVLWLALMVGAVVLDRRWLPEGPPMLSLLIASVGVAGGVAWVVRLATGASSAPPADPRLTSVSSPALISDPPVVANSDPAIRIYLLGPLRVYRQGELLTNTSEVWRSAKTRSLLAYLALRGKAGATPAEISEALWPPLDEQDDRAEARSRSAMRSYLTTLRQVLQNGVDGAEGGPIAREGERYFLREHPGLWVDVWAFRAQIRRARAAQVRGRPEEAIAAWEAMIALHPMTGLLPDEMHLPAAFLEVERQELRRCWLDALCRLARYHAERGEDEQASEHWEQLLQAESWHEEAYGWLRGYYGRRGQVGRLRELAQARARAEAEWGEGA